MRRLATIAAAVLLVVLGASNVLGGASGSSLAWIDKPLEWVTIRHDSVGVLAHVADSDGVGSAALSVDGRVVDEVATAGASLEVVEFSWMPEESGVYELKVTGFDTAGGRGGESVITVVVDLEGDTPATTTTTGGTTTTTTPATTTTACSPGIPSPTSPTGLILTETPTMMWSYSGCEPEYFEVQIADVPDFSSIVASEYIPGGGRQWTVPFALENCDTFYWRVRRYEEAGVGSWSTVATFEVYC